MSDNANGASVYEASISNEQHKEQQVKERLEKYCRLIENRKKVRR